MVLPVAKTLMPSPLAPMTFAVEPARRLYSSMPTVLVSRSRSAASVVMFSSSSTSKALASIAMLLGYGIIAVPTGIVTLELTRAATPTVSGQSCPVCGAEGHDADARYCKYCGSKL